MLFAFWTLQYTHLLLFLQFFCAALHASSIVYFISMMMEKSCSCVRCFCSGEFLFLWAWKMMSVMYSSIECCLIWWIVLFRLRSVFILKQATSFLLSFFSCQSFHPMQNYCFCRCASIILFNLSLIFANTFSSIQFVFYRFYQLYILLSLSPHSVFVVSLLQVRVFVYDVCIYRDIENNYFCLKKNRFCLKWILGWNRVGL